MSPAFRHFCKMTLSVGMWGISHPWLILSKQDLMSPASIPAALVRGESALGHCSMASAQLRALRNP